MAGVDRREHVDTSHYWQCMISVLRPNTAHTTIGGVTHVWCRYGNSGEFIEVVWDKEAVKVVDDYRRVHAELWRFK